MKTLTAMICSALLVPIFGPAYADTIGFNNLREDSSYANLGNWFGTRGTQKGALAASFVSAQSGVLDELWLGMFYEAGVNEVTLTLYDDVNGNIGGTSLWRNTYAGQLGSFGTLLHVNNLNGHQLQQGGKYWLVAEAPDDGLTRHNWYKNASDDLSRYALNYSDTWLYFDDKPNFAVKIGVTPVPLPASALLFASGLLGLSLYNKAWRIS